VLEVGPGTGQATRDLLDRGALVDAIEIGPNMAAKLRQVLPAEQLRVTVGDFETVPSDRGRFDAVFAANAYHWITRGAQVDRPAQLLVRGGLVAILDLNDVDPPIRAAFSADDRFIDIEVRSYNWNQTYSAAEYRTLMMSYSGTNMMQPGARRGLLDDMEAFVRDTFDDRVTRPLVVTLTTARLAA
jgi:SAM-dependent methyltransferase